MNRGFYLLALLVLAASYVSADAFLVDPLVAHHAPGKLIDVGSIQPGEEMELIFSTDAGYGKEAKWLQARYERTPYGELIQTHNSEVGTESLITRIYVSTLLPPGEYRIPITFSGELGVLENEKYMIRFMVARELFSATLQNPRVEGKLNEPLTYEMTLVNDSSASVTARIEPTLPNSWSEGKTTTIKPHSFQNISIQVIPRFAGPKNFEIHVTNTQNLERYSSLRATLTANASLKDQYAGGLYGFPFFTISLLANYLANAFFSIIL